MDTMNEDLAYFRLICSDPDAVALPLADAQAEGSGEALLRCALPDGLGRSQAELAGQKGLGLTSLYETAAMLLLGRYCGNAGALCALVCGGRRVPVYCSFEKETSFAGCCRGIKAQADEAMRRGAIGFDALCEKLGLAAMPVLTDDRAYFDSFSLQDAAPATALCLFFDGKAGAVCAKYSAAQYREDTMSRLLDSLTAVLQAVARGEDDI